MLEHYVYRVYLGVDIARKHANDTDIEEVNLINKIVPQRILRDLILYVGDFKHACF